jgi:hypothetical protein
MREQVGPHMGGPSQLMQFTGANCYDTNCYDRWKLFIIAGTASSARIALDAHNFLLDSEMDEFGATV